MALVDREGRVIDAHRAQERFAFCSTFKLPLAGMILDGGRAGKWALDEQLPIRKNDLTFHSPVTTEYLERGWMTVREAAEAIVTVSDNAAANLLLKRAGGIAAFNQWLAAHGDRTTHLDRLEPALNQNASGDPRDTTTPEQMARTASGLIFGDWLEAEEKELLRKWLVASETGRDRIRAGIPSKWLAGDKTGTCGGEGRSFNDVAFIVPANGSGYSLAVYLDRPAVEAESANRAIADVARSAVGVMDR